jgi:hypothetical protein
MIYRGANLVPIIPYSQVLEKLQAFKDAGMSAVRWSLFRDPNQANVDTVAQWRQWIDEQMQLVSTVVPKFTELGLYMILDLHTPPGGEARIWRDPIWQAELVNTWKTIAQCCVLQPNIPLYDLLNEPLPPNPAQWNTLAKTVISAIRAIEPGKWISLQSKGAAGNFLTFMEYIPNVIYSFHFYDPSKFTYQGVPLPGMPPYGRNYLSADRTLMRANLKRIRGFQTTKLRNAQIYCGELDCVRWAPNNGCYAWMRDALQIIQGYKWHWTFLCYKLDMGPADFFEQGFSTNHGPPQGSWSETERIKLLQRAFKGLPL